MNRSVIANASHRVVGLVQVVVAGRVHMVSIETADRRESSGFFVRGEGDVGIFVPEGASPREVDERVRAGMEEVVHHFSRRLMN